MLEQLARDRLSAEQADAHDAILDFERSRRRVMRVGGRAGSGKSHLLTHVVHDIREPILAAPTNVVARRLRATTGLPATTLHRLLYKPLETLHTVGGVEQRALDWLLVGDRRAVADRIVLIDEASLVPKWIADDLLDLGARIIAFGDPFQLPPVNAEPFLTELDVELHQIHRQCVGSGIIRQAHAVLDGQRYRDDRPQFRVVDRVAPHLDWADVALCYRNSTRTQINNRIRRWAGNDGDPPQRGEPLIAITNDYTRGIYNGELFEVMHDMRSPSELWLYSSADGTRIRIDRPWIETITTGTPERGQLCFAFGFCLTTHKAQGNEWPRVAIIDEVFGDPGFRRAWRYSAVTRGREAVVIGKNL